MYKGERLNSISHLIGAIAGLVGLVVLVAFAARDGDPWKIVSFSIYGTTLLFMFVVSTLYHSLQGRAKTVFHLLDYHSIYLLIAGSYTPFALVTLRGPWGWSILGVIWSLAVFGIIYDSIKREGSRVIPMILYLVMGWLILAAISPLVEELTLAGVLWLFIGGLFYTVGVIFFLNDHRFKHFHGIWHMFVLAGGITHYFTMFYFVL
ncbi:hypothetical protein TDB9533_00617 [Thalassocella blandensis]|nr:hypothetical protein TDB9533_00617 [Thalassocella blandensis]